MGLDLRWTAHDRATLDELLDPRDHLNRALARQPPTAYPQLRGIDPYADTDVSPSTQLIAEIRHLRDAQSDPEVSMHLNRLLSIAEAALCCTGSYLHFVGD